MRQLNLSTVRTSVNLDLNNYNQLENLAIKSFRGDKTAAINWILRELDLESFYRNLAKHHASMMNHFKSICDALEEAQK